MKMKSGKMKLTEKQRVIQTYMDERDHPAWYRGLSVFQIEAADSLLNCIRDDSQQSTSHRVRDALRRIGIEPLVGPSKVKLVMHLSRGNDIAFLWFLMELYYHNPDGGGDPRIYSINEQIFLTVIAYLDTIPTIRELDKLLPKKIPDVKKTKTQPVKRKRKTKSRTHLVCPYFQKQPRPILYGKDLTMKENLRHANFSEYEHHLQPNRCVLNENSRWFGEYELKTRKRFSRAIIDEQMETVFAEHVEKSRVCQHHQSLVALKKSMENTRAVAMKKDCEKYFDVEGYFQYYQSYKRVMDQVNSEIEKIKNSKLGNYRTTFLNDDSNRPLGGSMDYNRPSDVVNGSINEVLPKFKKTLTKAHIYVIELDPHNTDLIFEIVKKGLDELKKDKKFVLATLPDAHKWPILKEWARKRFGLFYSREEKLKDFQRTKNVFYYLRKDALNVQVPTLEELSQKQMVSYGCRDYLIKKGNYLRDVYQFNFKKSLLEDTRVYWSAFRPYQCSKGPPRNEFFSYLPARKNDIHMFRPWKKYEYIPAHAEWIKRRRKMSVCSTTS